VLPPRSLPSSSSLTITLTLKVSWSVICVGQSSLYLCVIASSWIGIVLTVGSGCCEQYRIAFTISLQASPVGFTTFGRKLIAHARAPLGTIGFVFVAARTMPLEKSATRVAPARTVYRAF